MCFMVRRENEKKTSSISFFELFIEKGGVAQIEFCIKILGNETAIKRFKCCALIEYDFLQILLKNKTIHSRLGIRTILI